jgi:hypothetical protein
MVAANACFSLEAPNQAIEPTGGTAVTASTLIRRALTIGATIVAALAVAAGPAGAASKDRNHDRIPDRWEAKHGLSLDRNQANRDQDRDKLDNRGEFRAKSDPRDDDSDDDGVDDGDEGAGTIASFDETTGVLVINAFNGDTVTGTVTDDTEIECDNDDETQPDQEGDDDHSGPGHDGADDDNDDVGDDDDDVGDDDGDDGPGHDEGDDDGDESGHGGPGHDRSHGDDEDEDEDCSVADLTAGTVVHEAELELTGSGLVFEEIEL